MVVHPRLFSFSFLSRHTGLTNWPFSGALLFIWFTSKQKSITASAIFVLMVCECEYLRLLQISSIWTWRTVSTQCPIRKSRSCLCPVRLLIPSRTAWDLQQLDAAYAVPHFEDFDDSRQRASCSSCIALFTFVYSWFYVDQTVWAGKNDQSFLNMHILYVCNCKIKLWCCLQWWRQKQ